MAVEAGERDQVRVRPWSWSDAASAGWAVALAVLLLGPALAPGYVLTYDMVWVPDLALRSSFSGVASSLPRAVPSDAVVALLDEVVPGMLLQKLVLLGALVGAGLGVARLLTARPLAVRLVAVTVTIWNPFVVERLVIGHWPVLLGYAVAPWLVVASRTWHRTGRFPSALLVLVPLGALSASAGVATALLLVALCLDRARWRTVLALAVAANLPWLVSGLLHSASATSDALGAQAFALRSEGSVPGPVAALTLGGIWNGEVVPSSREGLLGWLTLIVVGGAVVTGLVRRRWAANRREAVALATCWGIGWVLAVLTFVAPAAVGALATHVPGGGLVRDGSRLLVLCLPLLVLAVAEGTDTWWSRLPASAPAHVGAGVALVLAPIALLPDAAWGVSGSLHAAEFPLVWEQARPIVADDHDRHGGEVLVLPASSYRLPAWNDATKVLDPIGRYLTPDYVSSDVLVVSGVALAGEDPRAESVLAALELPDPEGRARALEAEGIGTVVVERDAPGPVAEIAGKILLDTGDLSIISLPDPDPRRAPTSWIVLMALAWSAYVAPLAAALSRIAGKFIARRRRRRV